MEQPVIPAMREGRQADADRRRQRVATTIENATWRQPGRRTGRLTRALNQRG
jgi:hypothetical protein